MEENVTKKTKVIEFIALLFLTGIVPILAIIAMLPFSSNPAAMAAVYVCGAALLMFAFGYISGEMAYSHRYLPIFIPCLLQLVTILLTNCFPAVSDVLGLLFILFGGLGIAYLFLAVPQFIAFLCELITIAAFLGGNLFGMLKRKAVPEKKNFKLPVIMFCVCLLLSAANAYAEYYKSLVTVDIENKDLYLDRYIAENNSDNGYGFPYENGWSSVSLRPYYVELPNNKLAKLDEPSSFIISDAEKMPVLDGAEAAYPVYSAFANACYENIAEIQQAAKDYDAPENAPMPIQFTNTVEAFKSLVSGEVDIFLGAKPSAEQEELAEEAGKELVLTPIGKEAFVFFVSRENPVEGLSSEQIRDIYSGKIANWKKLGGGNIPILAFQRPKNSGSQTMMEYFMGNVPLKEPLKVEFEYSMVGVVKAVAEYQNKASSIGYSFRFYTTQMTGSDEIKFLAVDGVYPDGETVSDGSYPLTTELYAITLADNPNENVRVFTEWMVSEQGQKLVSDTGYIPVK